MSDKGKQYNYQVSSEEMEEMKQAFRKAAEVLNESLKDLKQTAFSLQTGEFVGSAAETFYADMESVLLPSIENLKIEMAKSEDEIDQITEKFQIADSQAALALSMPGAEASTLTDVESSALTEQVSITLPSNLEPTKLEFDYDGILHVDIVYTTLLPFIDSIVSIQRVINSLTEIDGIPSISYIKKGSIQVELLGVGEAYDSIKKDVLPWWRRWGRQMNRLEQQHAEEDYRSKRLQNMRVEIQFENEKAIAELEIEDRRLKLEQQRQEIARKEAEIEALRVQNEKEQFELAQAKIELARGIIQDYSGNRQLSVDQLMVYINRLLPAIDQLARNPLLSSLKDQNITQ